MQIMQSFTINVDEGPILSLSEDDEPAKDYEYRTHLPYSPDSHSPATPLTPSHTKLEIVLHCQDDDDTKEYSPSPKSPTPPHSDIDDEDDDHHHDDDDEQYPATRDKVGKTCDDNPYHGDKKEVEDDEKDHPFSHQKRSKASGQSIKIIEQHFDYDRKLTLHSDINIAKRLNQSGYSRVCKLICTDQGSVWRARSSKGQDVVIKMASKLYYTDKSSLVQTENILNEIALIQSINALQKKSASPVIREGVIQMVDSLETDKFHVMVVEDGGIDLFSFVQQCHDQIARGQLTICQWQKTVRLISKRLIEILHWLHTEVSVCHLDVSLENVLISNVEWISYPDQHKERKKKLAPSFQLKLIDFGAAQQFETNVAVDVEAEATFESVSVSGKPTYCSPQIFALQNQRADTPDAPYDARKADIWSFGVCLFTMAIGYPPWIRPDQCSDKRFETIVVEQDVEFVLSKWNRGHYATETMRDLIQRIFVMKESERISTKDMLQHSWF